MNDSELIAQASSLGPVPDQAARDYRGKALAMLEDVNARILDHPDVARLTGANPASVVRDNHENHVHFMSTVLLFDDLTLLVRTLPWVYRTYGSHGFSEDYFPVVLGAWKDAVERHLGGSTAPPVARIYDWMAEHHGDVARLASSLDEGGRKPGPEAAELADALIAGDARRCIDAARAAVAGPEDLARFYEDLLRPAMYEVGRRWEMGLVSVAEEHLATSVAQRLVSVLYSEVITGPAGERGTAIVSSVVNEFHDLGARLLADVMEAHGWKVFFLGANTPMESLVSMAGNVRPDLVMLSVSLVFNLERARLVTEAIRENDSASRTRVMVGGQAFSWSEQLARKVGADGWAPDARSAVSMASAWVAEG